jgi:hypothetical protein
MAGLYNEKRERRLVDRRIALLAARQHGVFTRLQALRCGATDESIQRRSTQIPVRRARPRAFKRSPRLRLSDEQVAIETDGFRYHDRRHEFDDERARGNDLQGMGWQVLRVTSKHLEEDPEGVGFVGPPTLRRFR